jgi:uncharacterized protein (TIGR04255 family)
MGIPLKNPPVYFTLVQVRFNPILKLGDYLPSIQEAFRRADFPDFQTQTSVGVRVTMENGQAKPEPQSQQRYLFGDIDKHHSFLLESASLTLQSTDYGRFELFSKRFEEGLERVNEAVDLDFIERVGLRYLDRIAPLQKGESLQAYIAKEALGLSDLLGGDPAHSYCETLTQLGGVKLLVRVFTHTASLGFPPDIGPPPLQLLERFLSSSAALHAVLDTDGFVERRDKFSIETVHKYLDDIHKVISTTFDEITTPHAKKMWNK